MKAQNCVELVVEVGELATEADSAVGIVVCGRALGYHRRLDAVDAVRQGEELVGGHVSFPCACSCRGG